MNHSTIIALSLASLSLMACFSGPTPQAPNQGVVPGKAKKPAVAAQKETLLSPDETAKIGDIRISIIGGSVGKITSRSSFNRESTTKDDFFQIKIRVENLSETKLLDYQPWSGVDRLSLDENPRVTDEHGNRYDVYRGRLGNKSDGFVGHVKRVDPGQSVDDTFAFEKPVDRAKEFTVRFTGRNVGNSSANATYKIPRAFFEQ